MTDHVRVVTAFKTLTARNTQTMQGLWRLAAWGTTAACALLIALLATRGEVAARRAAAVLSSLGESSHEPLPSHPVPTQVIARQFDAQAETRRLSDAVRGLAAESDELKSRVAVVEHAMDDVTGSITKQVEAVRAAPAQVEEPPWPDNAPPVLATTAAIVAALAPTLPPPTQYGVDIGTASSIPTLRARWAGMRSAHPQLFDGLRPVVMLKEMTRPNRVELRLVAGPLASADAAGQLCGDLVPFRLSCQPTIIAGQHLALE
jgi:hypothetical protein